MNVLIFGDSNTQGFHDPEGGWADRLKRNLLRTDKQSSVFNLGISGETTGDVLRRFKTETASRINEHSSEDTLIVFAIGVNDTYVQENEKAPRTDIEIFSSQFKELVEASKQFSRQTLVCSILPVDESRTMPTSWMNITYANLYVIEYNSRLREVSDKLGVVYLDLFSHTKGLDWNKLLDDGLHPNSEGHKWVSEMVNQALKEL